MASLFLPGPAKIDSSGCQAARSPCPFPQGADLHLGVQRQQADGAVGRGQGVGDIAAHGGDIAHLRAADDAATLGQRGAVAAHQRVALDVAVRHRRADHDPAIFRADRSEPADGGDVDQRLWRGVIALLHVEDQVGAAGDKLRVAAVLCQQRQCLVDRLRRVIGLPAHDGLRYVAWYA